MMASIIASSAMGQPPDPPSSHDPLQVKCGTPQFMRQAKSKTNQPLFALPAPLPDSLISQSGRFVIYYTAGGSDTNAIATPEFVTLTAAEFDSAYDLEIGTLGYVAPPSTLGNRYMIYLVSKPYSAYGATVPLFGGGEVGSSPSGLTRIRSYIELDDKFSDAIYATKGYDALRITAFHEFFHMVQFGSYGHDQSFSYFQEMSSVWMEILSTPSVPDYLHVVGQYFSHLDDSFDETQNGGYGMGIYFTYLTNRFGFNVIREIWDEYSNVTAEPIAAIEAVLGRHGSNFCSEYKRFGSELVSAGPRYSGGSLLPDPQQLPVDSLHVNTLAIGQQVSITAFPASLQFYDAGFNDRDTCLAIVSRNTDRSVVGSGTISIVAPGSYSARYSNASLFCDSMVCFGSQSVFPQPFVVSQVGNDLLYVQASAKLSRPVSTRFSIYSLRGESIYHSELPATARSGSWNAVWNGRDDAGNRVPSGIYLYDLLADGVRSEGKIVLVLKP